MENTKDQKPFEDTSYFQGFCEYKDIFGNDWRQEEHGAVTNFWKMEDYSWVLKGSLSNRTCFGSIGTCHNKFLEVETCEQ